MNEDNTGPARKRNRVAIEEVNACPILNLTQDRLLDIFSAVKPGDIGQLRLSYRGLKQIIDTHRTRLPQPLVNVVFRNGKEKAIAEDMHYSFKPRTAVFLTKKGRRDRCQSAHVARGTSPHQVLTEDIRASNLDDSPTGRVIQGPHHGHFAIHSFRVEKGYLNDDDVSTLNESLPIGIPLRFSKVDMQDVKLATFCSIIKSRPLALLYCFINPSTWTTTPESTNFLAETRASHSNILTISLNDGRYCIDQRILLLSQLIHLSPHLEYVPTEKDHSDKLFIFQRIPRGICSSLIMKDPTDEILLNLWHIPHLTVSFRYYMSTSLEGVMALVDLYTQNAVAAKARIYIRGTEDVKQKLREAGTWRFERGDFSITVSHIGTNNARRMERMPTVTCDIEPINKDSN